MSVLLTTAYCPTAAYLAAMAKDFTLLPGRVIPSVSHIEAKENYQKQSWRNRCRILTESGPTDLNFPIVHTGGTHNNIPITEVEVDYATDWVHLHKKAIESAYSSSAFFEYYKDEFFEILDSRPERLFDLNMKILRFLLEKTGVASEIRLTTDFVRRGSFDGDDLREIIHPKRPDTILKDLGLGKPYHQVFSDRYGFTDGLSALDLLFNEGPDSILWLKKI